MDALIRGPELGLDETRDLLMKESNKVTNLVEVVAILWGSLCNIRDMVDAVDHPFVDPPPHAAIRAAIDDAIAKASPKLYPPLSART